MQRSPRQVGLTAVTVLTMAIALTIVTGPVAVADPPLSCAEDIPAYLVGIGVNPDDAANAICQEGLRNYAGPSCPGASWNCVRANAPIVQIASPLGTNLFYCTGLDCVVVQVALSGGQNGGACDRTDKHSATALQVCDITQANDGNPNSTNAAGIQQNIQQSSGSVQDARQVARITQTNSVGRNIAHIHQVVGQSQNAKGSAPVTQTQEAHQAATVSQTTLDLVASELGDNSSNVNQRQNQSQRGRTGSSITQNQNTAVGGNLNPFACDQPDGPYDQQKNQCADVTQHSGVLDVLVPVLAPGGGDNDSTLNHQITQRQTAEKAETVNQSQGAFSSGEAGNKEQLSSGVSTGTANQDMLQTQSAPPSAFGFQDQRTGDPRCCWAQFGNTANSASITQATNQVASDPNAFQDAVLQADCDSTGMCHVQQDATIDGDTNSNSCDDTSCHFTVFNSDGGED